MAGLILPITLTLLSSCGLILPITLALLSSCGYLFMARGQHRSSKEMGSKLLTCLLHIASWEVLKTSFHLTGGRSRHILMYPWIFALQVFTNLMVEGDAPSPYIYEWFILSIQVFWTTCNQYDPSSCRGRADLFLSGNLLPSSFYKHS